MDDYAAYLIDEANSDIVALHQFRILYDSTFMNYHFFFEGEEDSLFYMPEARRRLSGKTVNTYDCGGKNGVILVRDTIKKDGYDMKSCLFFVDRDYDDFLGTQVYIDQYTYITDNYSIENDMATAASVHTLLEDVVRMSRADPEFARVDNSISQGFSEFYREIRPLMAWIIAAKQSGCSPNLQNTKGLKGIVALSGGSPSLTKHGFKNFKKQVVVNGKVPQFIDVLRWRRQLDLNYAKMWVRGKYDIWFFQNALLALLEETNRRRKAAGGKVLQIPGALRDGRIFEILGGRVPPPTSLRAFYDARLI